MLFILTGPVHSGKTSLLKRMVAELKNNSVSAAGFLCVSIWEHDQVAGYDLLRIETGETIPFIRRTGNKKWECIGPFFFIPETLKKAQEVILQGRGSDVVIIDEVGPLELQGKGLWPALRVLLKNTEINCLLVVREYLLDAVLKSIDRSKEDIRIFDVRDKDILSALLAGLK